MSVERDLVDAIANKKLASWALSHFGEDEFNEIEESSEDWREFVCEICRRVLKSVRHASGEVCPHCKAGVKSMSGGGHGIEFLCGTKTWCNEVVYRSSLCLQHELGMKSDSVCDHYRMLAQQSVNEWDGQDTEDLIRSIYNKTGETRE